MEDALAALGRGGKRALARALAEIEAAADAPKVQALLDDAHAAARAHTIGLTGPPGVGKSTLTASLIDLWRAQDLRVGVIAVDPSSRRSGGALLGDRTRLRTDPDDDGVYVRSMAARDRLGGLADLTMASLVLMRALFDRVLVETVGVGQSETDIAGTVDTVVLCLQPGAGDSLQFMKAGILEIPHLAVVTKADTGEAARRTRADLEAALRLFEPEEGMAVTVLSVSAATGEGIDALGAALEAERRRIVPDLARRRRAQDRDWLERAIRERWGSEGLAAIGPVGMAPGESPFAGLRRIARSRA
jgi:LAO/AO transport system kinase